MSPVGIDATRPVEREGAPALSIGTIIGGWSEAKLSWDAAFEVLTKRLIVARAGIEVPLRLNVVYQVPGEILAPDFEGIRTSTYSRRRGLLMVQVAVPAGVPADPNGFVRESLFAAIDVVGAWASKRKVAADVEALRGIARRATSTSDIAER